MRGREVTMLRRTLGEGAIQYPLDFEGDQEERLLAEARAIALRRVLRHTKQWAARPTYRPCFATP